MAILIFILISVAASFMAGWWSHEWSVQEDERDERLKALEKENAKLRKS